MSFQTWKEVLLGGFEVLDLRVTSRSSIATWISIFTFATDLHHLAVRHGAEAMEACRSPSKNLESGLGHKLDTMLQFCQIHPISTLCPTTRSQNTFDVVALLTTETLQVMVSPAR